MTDDSEPNERREELRALHQRIEEVEAVNDAEKQFVRAVRLVERIIKRHFLRTESGELQIGPLLQERQLFLESNGVFDSALPVEINRRLAHDTVEGEPTDDELKAASNVLLGIAKLHYQDLAARNGQRDQNSETVPDRFHPKNRFSDRKSPEIESDAPRKYATHVEREGMPMLNAVESDPHVSVSTVAEYVFCSRAGILTHEISGADRNRSCHHWRHCRGTRLMRSKNNTVAASTGCFGLSSGSLPEQSDYRPLFWVMTFTLG